MTDVNWDDYRLPDTVAALRADPEQMDRFAKRFPAYHKEFIELLGNSSSPDLAASYEGRLILAKQAAAAVDAAEAEVSAYKPGTPEYWAAKVRAEEARLNLKVALDSLRIQRNRLLTIVDNVTDDSGAVTYPSRGTESAVAAAASAILALADNDDAVEVGVSIGDRSFPATPSGPLTGDPTIDALSRWLRDHPGTGPLVGNLLDWLGRHQGLGGGVDGAFGESLRGRLGALGGSLGMAGVIGAARGASGAVSGGGSSGQSGGAGTGFGWTGSSSFGVERVGADRPGGGGGERSGAAATVAGGVASGSTTKKEYVGYAMDWGIDFSRKDPEEVAAAVVAHLSGSGGSTPDPERDPSLSVSGDPIVAAVFGRAFVKSAREIRVRSPRSDQPMSDDTSLAGADVDWSMVGFDPALDPTPYAGAALAGGIGPAAIRDDYTSAVSATNGGGGSTGGLRPSAVGVGGGPILAFRPDMDSPTDRGKVDEATMLVDHFTTIPGSSGDVPGGGGDPAAMRSSTPAVGGSGSTIGTIGGMALLGGAMVSINQGVGKVQPGAVAGTYRRK